MTEQLQARLDELKQEYQLGESRLRELTQQEVLLRETLLRISGAVQVLSELIESSGTPDGDAAAASRSGDDPAAEPLAMPATP